MDCQLERLPDAGRELGRFERSLTAGRKLFASTVRRAARVARDPALVLVKAGLAPPRPRARRGGPVVPPPLRLQAGERVRVKDGEAIRATLDRVGDCEGLGFMPVQEAFCGREFTVRSRVERFFDERTRRMLRIRNTVILDGVFCEPPAGGGEDYAGCQRACFLFWKEAWLERVEPP